MSLPFMLDIAIGLIFIFLILSLLVAEIQEIITAVLQWRAQHLKESLEILLAGGVETQNQETVKALVDKLYDDPLIKNINYEAKGIPGQMRKLIRWLLPIDFTKIFGGDRTTGPSYMAAETFTASFLEQAGLVVLARKLIEVRLENFVQRIVGLYDVDEALEPDGTYTRIVKLPVDDSKLQESLKKGLWNKGRIRLIAEKVGFKKNDDSGLLDNDPDFRALVEEFADIVLDFKNEENNLETSIFRIEVGLNTYIEHYPLPKLDGTNESGSASVGSSSGERSQLFARELRSLKKSIFGDEIKKDLASDTLRTSLLDFAELLDKTSQTYQEVQKAFEDLIKKGRELDKIILPIALDKLIDDKNHEVLIEQVLIKYPANLIYELIKLKRSDDPADQQIKELLNKHPYGAQLEERVPELAVHDSQKIRKLIKVLNKRSSLPKKTRKSVRSSLSTRLRKEMSLLSQLRALWSQLLSEWQRKVDERRQRKKERQQRKLLSSIMYELGEGRDGKDIQIKILRSIIDSLENERFSDLEKDRIGLIDCAFDHLSNEDRHILIYDSITVFKEQHKKGTPEEWSKEYELKQRSLYSEYETYKRLQIVLSQLPNSIKESFAILARRAQSRLGKAESNVEQFRKEVAVWFDRSMARTSGVYKRNAKGVSILLGLAIAFIMNVDTLYIASRLSNDENLRRIVTEGAIGLSNSNKNQPDAPEELDRLRSKADKALKQMALPIGWNPQNLYTQLKCFRDPDVDPNKIPTSWQAFYEVCLAQNSSGAEENPKDLMARIRNNSQKGMELLQSHLATSFSMLIGWLISGFAISMGAPFWFDLLNRVINVRQAGKKPESNIKQHTEPNNTEVKS